MDDLYILQATYCNYNYGSLLQCYATQKYFENYKIKCYLVKVRHNFFERVINAISRRVEFVFLTLKYPEIYKERKKQILSDKNSKKSITELSRKYIEEFLNDKVNILNKSNLELKKMAKNNKCICCLAGSDQIWNSARIYIQLIYFLNFSPKEKRYAFAPSFGGDEIKKYNIRRYEKYLKQFSKLSVREESGVQLVYNLIGKKPEKIMDPVFLLSENEWKMLIKDLYKDEISEKYIFAFFLDEPSKLALEMLEKLTEKRYKIYMIGYKFDSITQMKNVYFTDGDPLKFIMYILNAEAICTDSFHATAFSTIFHKKFYVFERNYKGINQSSRLKDFLKDINLYEQYERKTVNNKELDFKKADKLINDNYMCVKEYLDFINI